MRHWSLRLRLGLVLLGITALALFSAGASIYVAETARDDAAAINKAGSLRMQSYRIAALLYEDPSSREAVTKAVETFQTILTDPTLKDTVRGSATPERQYRSIRDQWIEALRPQLTTTTQTDEGRREYLVRIDGFVDTVDEMVTALQRQAEQRIHWLRITQVATMVATVMLALGAMFLMHSRVVKPLRELMATASRIRHRDFTARASDKRRDEIAVLGRSFNTMAAELEAFHQELEHQVEHKTRELRRSNEALQLLHKAEQNLTPGHLDDCTVPMILKDLERLLDTGPVSVYLDETDGNAVPHRISSRARVAAPCEERTDAAEPITGEHARQNSSRGGISIPLQDHGCDHGVLMIEHPPNEPPQEWKQRLAVAVAKKIATTRDQEEEARYQRRLALMEERTAIARELHDSLAQSLSYLKIQVTRLDAGLSLRQTDATVATVVTELRNGLNMAYGQLRSLLTTFRLQINEPGFQEALESAAKEYRQRPDAPAIHLSVSLHGLRLDTNAEIHILHIAREALANVASHAHARHCWVQLKSDDSGEVHLRVEDDGVGILEDHERPHHYGIRIMAERAHSLGGEINIRRRSPRGTRIEIRFPARDNDGEAHNL